MTSTLKHKTLKHEFTDDIDAWIRTKMPDSKTGFIATDIDMVFANYTTKRFCLIEFKCRMQKPGYSQAALLKEIHSQLKSTQKTAKFWQYCGLHLIQFEVDRFKNGKVFLNGAETTETALIEFFNGLINTPPQRQP